MSDTMTSDWTNPRNKFGIAIFDNSTSVKFIYFFSWWKLVLSRLLSTWHLYTFTIEWNRPPENQTIEMNKNTPNKKCMRFHQIEIQRFRRIRSIGVSVYVWMASVAMRRATIYWQTLLLSLFQTKNFAHHIWVYFFFLVANETEWHTHTSNWMLGENRWSQRFATHTHTHKWK